MANSLVKHEVPLDQNVLFISKTVSKQKYFHKESQICSLSVKLIPHSQNFLLGNNINPSDISNKTDNIYSTHQLRTGDQVNHILKAQSSVAYSHAFKNDESEQAVRGHLSLIDIPDELFLDFKLKVSWRILPQAFY